MATLTGKWRVVERRKFFIFKVLVVQVEECWKTTSFEGGYIQDYTQKQFRNAKFIDVLKLQKLNIDIPFE